MRAAHVIQVRSNDRRSLEEMTAQHRVRVDSSSNARSSAFRVSSPLLSFTVTCAFGIGALDVVPLRFLYHGLLDLAIKDRVLLSTKNRLGERWVCQCQNVPRYVTIYVKNGSHQGRLRHAAELQHLWKTNLHTVEKNMYSYGSVAARCAPPSTVYLNSKSVCF